MSYAYVTASILLTVYCQIALKWQMSKAGEFPEASGERVAFLLHVLMNPWIISALSAAVLAALSWMVAMTKLDLSHAYPFASVTFVLVLVLSGLLLNEPIGWQKIAGLVLVVCGVAISSQG